MNAIRAALTYILATFLILKRKDKAKFNGHYYSDRTILEIYDALADSFCTGHTYQAKLNPPPADLRCCQRPKTIFATTFSDER